MVHFAATAAVALSVVLAVTGLASAATYQVIYTLPPPRNGGLSSPLVAGLGGDLYEATATGGVSGDGYLFHLLPPAVGATAWTGTELYNFGAGAPAGPYLPGGLTMSGRTLLGVAANGGLFGHGATYRIAAGSPLTVLHAFAGASTIPGSGPGDGAYPQAAPALGLFGMYYGTTVIGGKVNGFGTVYAMNGSATNPSYSLLHRFGATGDGFTLTAGTLAIDAQGRVFGVTGGGGDFGKGTLFMLTHASGSWVEQVIYSFETLPYNDNVVVDAAGNLYVCGDFGVNDAGAVLEFTPPPATGGSWTRTDLYDFRLSTTGDAYCTSGGTCGLARDPASGRLYGISELGGTSDGGGTVFEIDPPTAGQSNWTEQLLHSFSNRGHENLPLAAPILAGGTLYGTAGPSTIWSVVP